MGNRNRFRLLAFLTAGLMLLSGCNLSDILSGGDPVTNKYGTNYVEYFTYMKPYLDNISNDYREEDGRIRIFLQTSSNSDEAFAGVLDAHNAYVNENSLYFDQDLTIIYAEEHNGVVFQFGNRPESLSYDPPSNISEIDFGNNGELQYCIINFNKISNYSIISVGDFLGKVKVLGVDISGSGKGYKSIPNDFSFIERFPNLEKVVFYTNWEYDETESFYDEVMSKYPSLEIYTESKGELIQQKHE